MAVPGEGPRSDASPAEWNAGVVDQRDDDVERPIVPFEPRRSRRRTGPAATGHEQREHRKTENGSLPEARAARAPSRPSGTVAQLIRSSRWSPTRSEFAIAVSAGLTAPIDGKTLVSTT